MPAFDTHSKRKTKLQNQTRQPEFLRLASEPNRSDYLPGRYLSLRYQNRYLAKRRVMRTIRRLRTSH